MCTRSIPMLTISINNKKYQIPYDSINYIESASRKLVVHTKDKDYSYYQRLDIVEQQLPSDQFIRIHKSYLIAQSFISSYTNYKVMLFNGIELSISATYRDAFKKKMQYTESLSKTEGAMINAFSVNNINDFENNLPHAVTGSLVCIKGEYKNSIIRMYPDKPILIGRDDCCDIIYDLPFISRRHCTLIFRANKNIYEIIDHSTNGTYVSSADYDIHSMDTGELVSFSPITPGIATEIHPGTVIHFGNADNLFRLV